MRETVRDRRGGGRIGAVVLGAALLCAPALAAAQDGMCDLEVFDASGGVRVQEADHRFKPNEQFIVCFRAAANGYVSLWDRMPSDAPVERLVPNANFRGEGRDAAKVSAGTTYCFGERGGGYDLFMDPRDGDGQGRMWLVFTGSEATHPDRTSFNSAEGFDDAWTRLGAGVSPSASADAALNLPTESATGQCIPRKNLDYDYVVREN